jgi:hypothetical protein
MDNKEWFRNKVKIHIRDVKMSDDELDGVIGTVIEEVAITTGIFKKIFGFSIHKDKHTYDFRYLARMNERLEHEPTEILFGSPEPSEILDFLTTGHLPSPTVNKTLIIEPGESRLFNVLDVFDKEGVSIMDRMEQRSSYEYFVYDNEWLRTYDNEQCAFIGSIIPDLNELHEENMLDIVHTVIAGCKFYINDTLHSPEDTQATNYDFMRWFQAKEILMNRFPTTMSTFTNNTRRAKWQ